MKAPHVPEAGTIKPLSPSDVVDAELALALEAITTLAAQLSAVPIAFISVVDGHDQWYRPLAPASTAPIPFEGSFLRHVASQAEVVIVRDATTDAQFADDPLVKGETRLRFYAGLPLWSPSGTHIGTLCIVDHVARDLACVQLEQLTLLAKLAASQLEASRNRAIVRQVVDGVPGMLAYWDKDQRCRFANAAYESWFGVKAEELLGRTMRELLGPIYPRNLPYIEGALRGEIQAFEREIPDPRGGPPRSSQAHYLPHVVAGEVQGFGVMVTDISRQKAVEAELREAQARAHALATHDSLTGLPNRLLAHERLERAIEQAKRFRRCAAVLFIDLDGFKAINDALGHAAGDTVLREVAARMLALLRHSDTVARLGGDEFLILLPEVEDSISVGVVAQKLLAVMAATQFTSGGQELNVSCSVGGALFPDHATNARELVARADAALYRAKRGGKNQFALFSAE
jgi:diguanylate cyclase (GGDEF)-like protein/PAS domain S-box-containing protein